MVWLEKLQTFEITANPTNSLRNELNSQKTHILNMKTIKKTIITLLVSGFLATANNMAYAEEAAKPAAPATTGAAQVVIKHLEEGLANAAKSDFSTATIHLKAARSSAAEISTNALEVHKGVAEINNGMKEVKLGQPEKAVAEIEQAIKIFKAL